MNNSNITPFGAEAAKDLKHKEHKYFCDHCGWMAEKNAVMVPECPQCRKPLSYVYQDKQHYIGDHVKINGILHAWTGEYWADNNTIWNIQEI